MKEVNKVSNIQVELETVMNGRSVVAVQFLVRPNPQLSLVGMVEEDDITSSRAYKALLKEGIGKRLAYDWVVNNGEDYVLEKIELVAEQEAKGKIKSSRSGYLISAIRDDFHSEVSTKRKQKEAANAARIERQKVEVDLDQTKKRLKEVELAYREKCLALIDESFAAIDETEQILVGNDFKARLSSKIFSDDFVRSGWRGRLVFADASRFWTERGVVFPAPDDLIHKGANKTASELRSKVKELEAKLL